MNRWFVGLILVGIVVAGGTTLVANAQAAPTMSPMASPMASATPMSTMKP